jgi:hypothetical protein
MSRKFFLSRINFILGILSLSVAPLRPAAPTSWRRFHRAASEPVLLDPHLTVISCQKCVTVD